MSISDPYRTARLELQRVVTHVLARARFEADGRFGLRVTPSGIATPAFGPEGTVIRITPDTLIREFREDGAAHSATIALSGRSLEELAAFAGVALTAGFSVGSDTPDPGDVGAPLTLDVEAVSDVLAWLRVGSVALDRVLSRAHEASVAQLWPEHFDIGIDVATDHGRVNLGASPGDGEYPGPYCYVSPWEGSRPGSSAFWNASFGAVMTRRDGESFPAHVEHAVTFFETGLHLLGGD